MEAYLGIDIGSSYSKAVALSPEGKVLATALRATSELGAADSAQSLRSDIEERLGGGVAIAPVVATGTGRMDVCFAEQSVNDVICHAKGAQWKNPPASVVVDLGGRASRVLVLGSGGALVDFVTDGGWTGGMRRLLDLLAAALTVDVCELGLLHEQAVERVELNEESLKHAEHQVMALLECGARPEDLVAAIHRSIARRIGQLLAWRLPDSLPDGVTLTGGFARNEGVVRSVEEAVGTRVFASREAPLLGAIGAALVARERASSGAGALANFSSGAAGGGWGSPAEQTGCRERR